MRQPIVDLPIIVDNASATLRATRWGGMACTYGQLRAGTDFTPLFEGLPGDMCQCPHWGYVLKGAIRVRYADRHEETLEPGDFFYLSPGHTASCAVDSAWVEVSPEKEYDVVGEHVGRKLASLAG